LTTLTAKEVLWKWGKEQQEVFEEIKKVISKDMMLAFPRSDKPFHVYKDMQEGRPLAFYSRKLNRAQKRYTTREQELLSRVETLKEFWNILLGQKVIVHTNHKNIQYGNQTNDRITRWRQLSKELASIPSRERQT
jgi:CMP-2-keto-3-deoxyoctulosonic acid synthetase